MSFSSGGALLEDIGAGPAPRGAPVLPRPPARVSARLADPDSVVVSAGSAPYAESSSYSRGGAKSLISGGYQSPKLLEPDPVLVSQAPFAANSMGRGGGSASMERASKERTSAPPSMKRASSERSPASSERSPASSERSPASSERAPASSERVPASSERAPASSERAPGPKAGSGGMPDEDELAPSIDNSVWSSILVSLYYIFIAHWVLISIIYVLKSGVIRIKWLDRNHGVLDLLIASIYMLLALYSTLRHGMHGVVINVLAPAAAAILLTFLWVRLMRRPGVAPAVAPGVAPAVAPVVAPAVAPAI